MSRMIIIGAGASGLFAAIEAANQFEGKVIILEGNDKAGKKILATGNGKCNFTNRHQSPDCYNSSSPEQLVRLLEKFPVERAIDFFTKNGMMITEKNGYCYPNCEQAVFVQELLIRVAKSKGVQIITGQKVTAIKQIKGGFHLTTQDSEGKKGNYSCDRVIVATGGKAAPKSGSDGSGYALAKQLGHTVIEPLPALCGLKAKEKHFKTLAGVRYDGTVSLYEVGHAQSIATHKGQIQFTDYGVSGIVIFQLSRFVSRALYEHKNVNLTINLLDNISEQQLTQYFEYIKQQKNITALEVACGIFPKKLGQVLLQLADIPADTQWKQVAPKAKDTWIALCRSFPVDITGTNTFEQAQVTAGGIPLTEVDENLQSIRIPNLYFTGEILDVDGLCGGYNLQWAWCSGYIAGHHAGSRD